MSNASDVSVSTVVSTAYAIRPARPKTWRRMLMGVVVVLVLAVAAVLAQRLGLISRVLDRGAAEGTVYVAKPVTLNVTLKEDGELKPVNSVDIKCEVQGQRTTIEWLVDESTPVKKGDLLLKLASEDMKDRVETEDIELGRNRSSLNEVRAELDITRRANASAIRKAEIDLEVAELELKRYLKGDYKKSVVAADIAIKKTQMQLDRVRDELNKSLPLREKGFVTGAKIDELIDDVERLEMELSMNTLAREILEAYEHVKNTVQKTSAVDQARDELVREQKRAESRETQALAKVTHEEQSLDIRARRFERLKEQLANCEIRSPADGVVQYGESGGRRYFGGNRIAVGEQVYQGQTMLTIPDTSKMMVTTRIHEADRHKIGEGLTCLVRVPAVPGRTFVGKLTKVAKFADSERGWLNPNLKEHAAEILLSENDAELSPGDTAHVEVLIEEVPDVLAVPVQCLFSRGAQRFVFKRGLTTEPVEVKVGRVTTTMAEITAGLASGDEIVMAPDERMLAKLPAPSTVKRGPREQRAAAAGV